MNQRRSASSPACRSGRLRLTPGVEQHRSGVATSSCWLGSRGGDHDRRRQHRPRLEPMVADEVATCVRGKPAPTPRPCAATRRPAHGAGDRWQCGHDQGSATVGAPPAARLGATMGSTERPATRAGIALASGRSRRSTTVGSRSAAHGPVRGRAPGQPARFRRPGSASAPRALRLRSAAHDRTHRRCGPAVPCARTTLTRSLDAHRPTRLDQCLGLDRSRRAADEGAAVCWWARSNSTSRACG